MNIQIFIPLYSFNAAKLRLSTNNIPATENKTKKQASTTPQKIICYIFVIQRVK
ncbi:hypothetical protein TUM3811_28210 [Shewanella algae]|nr:hypothetical protein TUM3811_28210 [Shewanella algae]